MKDFKYVNLRTYSHFTIGLAIGDGVSRAEASINKGHDGASLSDYLNMGGSLQFFNHCKKNNIPFTLGAELNITDDASVKNSLDKYRKIMVYAKNNKGLQNLNKLISIGSLPENFYYKPRIDVEMLEKYKEGLIVLSGDTDSYFINKNENDKSAKINKDVLEQMGIDVEKKDETEEKILKFKEMFGDDFYIELTLIDGSWNWSSKDKEWVKTSKNYQEEVNKKLIKLAQKHNISTVITYPNYIESEELKTAQDLLIQNSVYGKSEWVFNEAYSIKTKEDLFALKNERASYISDELFYDSCNNTFDIAYKSKDLHFLTDPLLPEIKYHELATEEELTKTKEFLKRLNVNYGTEVKGLTALVNQALDGDRALVTTFCIINKYARMDWSNKEYRERLIYELKVIQRNGMIRLCDYFLALVMVSQFLRKNKDKGFMQGPGRGSAAGSLLSYTLRITDIDPLKWGLLFERFLVKERIGTFIYKSLTQESA